jgi:hypothetical protein
VELLAIQPGVTATGEVLGARRDQNNVTLDGVDVNDNQNAGIVAAGSGQGVNGNNPGDAGLNAALPLPLDSVQEFRVTTAGQGAAQGRSSGGQVSLVTKSGSNQFHGSVYDFNRSAAGAANTWFNNRAGRPTEKLIRNQYGASLGGRIIRDRVFFFANWEDRKDRLERSQLRNVPSETFKQGIVSFRQSDGTIGQLSPAELRAIDPLGLGVSTSVQNLLRSYPAGNDPTSGIDRGLNFNALRFNAPFTRNDRAYVAKMDFNIDSAGKHTAFVRGTLADNAQDLESALAQFPGQSAAAKVLNNSRGISAHLNSVITPSLINSFTYGLTRLGIARTGTSGNQFSLDSISDAQNFGARAFTRIIPTHNIANDLTWIKGRHTIAAGTNIRLLSNSRLSFENSYGSYSFSRSTLRGLGADMEALVNTYIQGRSGNPALRLSEAANATRALGGIYGLVNQYSATYNYGRDGVAVPFGEAVSRSFLGREYEFYVQDSFRATRELTLNYGVRYSNTTPPWERDGVQVRDIQGLDRFFADRVGASAAGIAGAAMPTAALTYELAGPANGGRPSWFNRDNNNFAPRFSFAYAPDGDKLATKLMGKGSVLRGGFSMVYDRYGSDMIVEFDRSGSPGLASQVTQPRNTNFSDSARLDRGLPTLPAAQAARYPFTPATILGGFNSNTGVFPGLVAPYSMLMNLNYARNVAAGVTVELGYAGRLSRKNLLQVDAFQPLTEFRDPASRQSWAEAAGQLRLANDAGRTIGQVGPIPFFENMFPRLANAYVPGTATQNFYHLSYAEYAGSFLDALNDTDRERLADGTCYSRLGCNTFFALQNAGMRAWANAGSGVFHGGTLSIRRAVRNGIGFDFNYALSHSIDNASAAESGAGNGGAVLQDSFNPGAFRGSSDFDIRHNITANGVYELPFGLKKKYFSNSRALDYLVGGWQLSGLMRYRSGLPTTLSFGDVWPTNYLNSALAILATGATMPETGAGYNAAGNPSVFRQRPTAAVESFAAQFPGRTGTRAILRLDDLVNYDVAMSKRFRMPWEGHSIQFRAEAYNVFNNVNFSNLARRGDQPSTFGEFQGLASRPRELQFALRYEF